MASDPRRRALVIFSLILAGEAIFALPFHVARFFRATVLEVFQLSNAELGDVFAVYGVTAMLAYFPGGAIADRFSARALLSVSLIGTAAGGFYMATLPGVLGLSVLFAYWGITSILLFWAALIRSTREWGGQRSQGRAFGILDGGRGLLAAGLASVAVLLFGALYGDSADSVSAVERDAALVSVIYFYTVITLLAGLVTWVLVPVSTPAPGTALGAPWAGMSRVLRERVVWTQALIVVCAYCGYKGLDNYALYAVQVLGMSEVEGAGFAASCAYLRPVAAVTAGLIADRLGASHSIAALFVLLALSYGYLGFAELLGGMGIVLTANILFSFAGVYALRGVYFALLEESKVPSRLTGSAVGLISLVGFTPDIFFAAIGGRLLDGAPGIAGHQHYFLFLGGIMLLGVVATITLVVLTRRRPESRAGDTPW